ncbi:SCA7, zinc-binding domain-containing protein [Melampsora americana]|nr:SCA7, zinc-binding domain-containing protein [Melampsora americana]
MSIKLKPVEPNIASKLKNFESNLHTLSQATDRWKLIRALAKQQTAESPARPSPHSADEPGPIWIQRMETLFGPPDEQLRVIRCDNCGLQTREVNGRVCVTHKVNCEMTKAARMAKKSGLFAGVEAGSKKRASSEVSLDSSNPPPKKKKAMIIDHTTSSITSLTTNDLLPANLKSMTNKQIKKVLAQAERLEREKERKEKKLRDEEAKKANQKKMGRIKGGPVNVNEQCGVLIPPKDIPCARSLTCKTHSMGAKRSVPGRSAPYDVLLNEWQKKHNPNWGDRKVVTPRVGPGIEPGVSKKKKKEAARAAMGNTTTTGINKHGTKDKERDHPKQNGKSNNTHNRSFGGTGGGNGVSSGSKKKDGQHRGEGGRSTGDKLSAANEAKLLGEIDEDFYFPVTPPKAQTVMEVDGVITEEDPNSHSDVEVELIIKGLIASQPGQPLVTSRMGSAWVNPRWSNFGKLGVKESFRDAFRKR